MKSNLIQQAKEVGIDVKRIQIAYPQSWEDQLVELLKVAKEDQDKLSSIDQAQPILILDKGNKWDFGFIKGVKFNPNTGRTSVTVWNNTKKIRHEAWVSQIKPYKKK